MRSYTDEELAESIKYKLNKLCEIMGTIELRQVKHEEHDIGSVLSANNIIHNKVILNELKNKIIITPDNDIWILEKFKHNYKKAYPTQKLDYNSILKELFVEGIYGLEHNFFELYCNNKLITITETNFDKIYNYLHIILIEYALTNNIDIPYMDLDYSMIYLSSEIINFINELGEKTLYNISTIRDLFKIVFTDREKDYARIKTKPLHSLTE